MAARCGAVLSDMEFVQFHPTAFDIGIDPVPLATEALRGEGAKIINSKASKFYERCPSRGGACASRYCGSSNLHRTKRVNRFT